MNLDAIGQRQLGLVTASQLGDLGWSAKAIRHAVAMGRLVSTRRGVYRMAGAAVTQEQVWLGAVLASEGGVLSHGCAGSLWTLFGFEPPDHVDVLLPPGPQPRLKGVRGHRTLWLPPEHVTTHRRVPVTTCERTLVDACGLVSLRTLEVATDDALRRKLIRLPKLTKVADDVPVSGRRKSRPILDVLAERVPGYNPGGSQPELDILRLIRRAGLPAPQREIRVDIEGFTYYIDLGWEPVKVGIEYDSYFIHGANSAFHGDRTRLRRLKRAGWDIWPVTNRTPSNEILAIAALASEQLCAA